MKYRELIKKLFVRFKEYYREEGLIQVISSCIGISIALLGVSLVHLMSLDRDDRYDSTNSVKLNILLSLPAILFFLVTFSVFAAVNPDLGNDSQSCFNQYGSDYVNFSGECLHREEAARKVAEMYPETYSIVKEEEIKASTGLDWLEFNNLVNKADREGLIYCYSKSTGFLSNQMYCKQSSKVRGEQAW